MTLDGRKDGRGSAFVSAGVMSVIVGVFGARMLFSDVAMVRIAGVVVVLVAVSLLLLSCWQLFRSKSH